MILPLPLPALVGLAAALSAAPGAVGPVPALPTPEVRAEGLPLLDQDGLAAGLAELATDPRATAFRVGTSRAGRPIDGVKLAVDDTPRPAVLLVASLDADRAWTSSVALELGRRLLADDPGSAALLATADVYLVPRLDVDGAARRFELPVDDHGGSGDDRDTDRDGVAGEDGPADVNDDGLVTMMRVPDPDGTWLADPHDPRAHVEADLARGERGLWRLVPEGLDADGDGEVAEDAPADGHVNHNFPAGFEDHGAAAGLYPGSDPAVRALMDFVILRPELVAVMTLDGQDTLVDAPDAKAEERSSDAVPSWWRRVDPPDGRVLASDADALAGFGRTLADLAEAHDVTLAGGEAMRGGSFQRWAYEHRGLLTLDCLLWTMPTEAPPAEEPAEGATDEPAGAGAEDAADGSAAPDTWRDPSDDAGRLAWIDAVGAGHRFVDWQPFDHPTLGPVEVGGWAPFALVEPPPAEHAALVDVHHGLLVSLAEALPAPRIAALTAEHLGADLWRVEARLENEGTLAWPSAAAVRARTVKPARATLTLPEGASLVVGEARTLVPSLSAGSPGELTWLVHAPSTDGLALELHTEAFGTARLAVTAEDAR